MNETAKTSSLPEITVGGTGHRRFDGDRASIKARIKDILSAYSREYRVTVLTCYAAGADILISECATELGLATKAAIPMPCEQYLAAVAEDARECGAPLSDGYMRKMKDLLERADECVTVPDPEFTYLGASRYVVEHCDKLIAIWDGRALPLVGANGEPINRGGTYHCITLARERGLTANDIHIVECKR